jgi:hypothetical protein
VEKHVRAILTTLGLTETGDDLSVFAVVTFVHRL